MRQYYKVWFTDGKYSTAKLIVDTEKYPPKTVTVETLSRLFPYTEAMKMKRLCMTFPFDSWTEAFYERGKAQDMCIPEEWQFYRYDSEGRITGVNPANK